MEQPQTTQEEVSSEKVEKKKGRSLSIIIVIVLIILGAGAFFLLKSDGLNMGSTEESVKVVATVNGIEVSQTEVDNRIGRNKTTLETQGNDLSNPETLALIESQIVTQLVNEVLVSKDADRLGITVTEDEVNTEYANIQARFETPELFQSELVNNFFTEETLRINIKRELVTQKYVEQISSQNPVEVTEEEIDAFYVQAKEQNAEIPPLEEVKDQVEAQIRNQKITTIVNGVVEGLRSNATIELMADSAE